MFKIGLDIGSTTAKIVVIDENDKIIFSRYRRHNTQMMDVVLSYLNELESIIGNERVSLNVSGSAGMGLAELYDFQFIQEVVAASKTIQRHYPIAQTMIDIGGEDAKIIKFVFTDELLNYRHHGMPLILVALMYAICQRVAVETHQQSQNDLRVLVTSFFGESRLAHVILPVSLKVKRRHVIEHHSDSFPCLTSLSISSSSELMAMVICSLNLLLVFSTTITLVLPYLFFFFLANILQK